MEGSIAQLRDLYNVVKEKDGLSLLQGNSALVREVLDERPIPQGGTKFLEDVNLYDAKDRAGYKRFMTSQCITVAHEVLPKSNDLRPSKELGEAMHMGIYLGLPFAQLESWARKMRPKGLALALERITKNLPN